jgi:hypothetical protein
MKGSVTFESKPAAAASASAAAGLSESLCWAEIRLRSPAGRELPKDKRLAGRAAERRTVYEIA